MTVAPEAPPIPEPGAADSAVRSESAGKRAPRAERGPVTDPEAPFGWMTDPKTGETRPKKRPGKQAKAGADSPQPPRGRANNQARDRRPTDAETKAAKTSGPDYSTPAQETLEAAWMILAGIPTPEKPTKVLGIDLGTLSIRAKAQAWVLEQNAGKLVHAINLTAKHNKKVREKVDKFTGETGPAWVLPAMMAVLPFAVQSASVWRAPVTGDLERVAKETDAKFDQLVKDMGASVTVTGENWGVAVTVPPSADSANGDSPSPA